MRRGVRSARCQVAGVRWQTCFLFILFLACFSSASFFGEDKSFDVDNALLKLVMKGEESSPKILKITSFGDNDFEIDLNGLDFLSLDESVFSLSKGGEKEVEILFDSKGKAPGIYSGELIILDGSTSRIPVIMEVESEDVLFDSNINVPLEYVNAHAGENMVFENKIFNLENIGSQNVEVSYFVRGVNGKTVFYDEENVVVESQILNTKVVSLPEDLDEGNYIFGVVIKYRNSVGTSTHFFKIQKAAGYSNITEDFFTWAVIALLIALIFFIVYYTKKRDDVLLELHREYKREIGKTAEAIEKEKAAAEKLKNEKKKKCALKNIAKKKKEREKAAKKIYAGRVRTVKTLRKHKRESEIDKKLRAWKKQGYNVDEIVAGGGESVEDYRKQGYKL